MVNKIKAYLTAGFFSLLFMTLAGQEHILKQKLSWQVDKNAFRYEVEIQNDHQWENDLMQVLTAVYDKAIDKPAVGPDNVKEYIQNRLTSKTPGGKDANTGETRNNLS